MESGQSGSDGLHKRALFLSYFTVGYNIIEGAVSIFAGVLAGSIALLGFGLDSFVESLSGAVMIWRFRQRRHMSEDEEERLEKRAAMLVGCTFFILGAYVLYESVNKLLVREVSEPSIIGIAVAIASIIVMPVLFIAKYRTGVQLKSKSLVADSKETLACLFLSVALLVGLGLNYLFGFWQADPIVGLLVVVFLTREGYEIITEKD